VHRLRLARWAPLLVGIVLVAAGCGGDGGGGGTTGETAIKQGGTLNYAADQEPTGFNNNTSKDNGTSVANIIINVFPQVFDLNPDYSVSLDTDLMESAEQTSDNPQTIVYKIKQNANWSDGTPVSADDFIYLWKNLNGSIESTMSATPPATTRSRA
jgi:peptide/nickel transport system substrate-binding protein